MKKIRANKKFIRRSLYSGLAIVALSFIATSSAKTPLISFRALASAVHIANDWKATCQQAKEMRGRYRCWVCLQGRDAQTGQDVSGRYLLCATRDDSLIIYYNDQRVQVVENTGKNVRSKHQSLIEADSVRLDCGDALGLKPVDWVIRDSSAHELDAALSQALSSMDDSPETSGWHTSDVTVSGRVIGKLNQLVTDPVAPIRAEGQYLIFENASLLDLHRCQATIKRGDLQLLLPDEVPHPAAVSDQDYSMLP